MSSCRQLFTATTGDRAPEFCWAPKRPCYVEQENTASYEDDDDSDADSDADSDVDSTENEDSAVDSTDNDDSAVDSTDDDEDYANDVTATATTGFRPPFMCWAPARPRN